MKKNELGSSVSFALAIAAATALAAPARAQDQPADPLQTEAAESADPIGDIVVTARRREETLQKVPVAVTAFTAEALETRGFDTFDDIQQSTPSLKFAASNGGNSGGFNAFIRGVGEYDFIVTSDPAVALYLDGVYVARSFGAEMDLADIERVEVLRGPQGSLFGKNTIGGAVSVTTRLPGDEFDFSADARYGSFNGVRLRASADVPLGAGFSAGLSALYRSADPWQTAPDGRGMGDQDAIAGRLKLRWRSDDGIDLVFAADARRQRQNGEPHNTIATNPAAPFPAFWGAFFGPCCELTPDPDKLAVLSPIARDDTDAYNLSFSATIPAGTGSIRSITAYRDIDAYFGRAINSVAPTFYTDFHDEQAHQWSQELQYTNRFLDDRLTLLAGLYYFREKSRDHSMLSVAPGLSTHPGFPSLLAFLGLPPSLAPIFDLNLDFDNRQTTTNYAAFGNLAFQFADRWSIDLGGRFTREEKSFYQKAQRIETNLPLMPQAPEYTLDDSWEAFTPKATLSFQATPDILTYLTYSRGFRSGGFNGRPTQFAEIGGYDPEKLDSFEAGLKTLLLDGHLRINAAIFSNSYSNQQIQINALAGDGVTIIARTENAGKSHMRGGELELTAVFDRHVSIDGSAAYLDSGYDRYVSNGVDLSGLKLRHAPRWTANAGLSLTTDEAGGLLGSFRIDASYKSRTELDGLNSPYLSQPGYVIGNINLGIDLVDTGWGLRFTAENFTDKRVMTSGFDVLSSFGIVEAYYNPPARYFVTLSYRR